ncbi:ABC transporter permease subunit [Streptomyces sp. NPDC000594]|uniref:ABC transporter permease n=1 Tax=Streptomyces sp. NPDC000594 TaxID=3154261 RepID=UPI0033177774
MSAMTTNAPAGGTGTAAPRSRSPLSGAVWVAWRRQRLSLLVLAAVAVALAVYCALERDQLIDFLDSGRQRPGEWLPERYAGPIDYGILLLNMLPLVVGVFVGAPLLAREEENGTLRLLVTQSVSRSRVVATTLAVPLLAVAVCTTAMSMALTWIWRPARDFHDGGNWWMSGAFTTTGPMPVALAVFATALGIAAGAVLRRSLAAMATTFVALFLVEAALARRVQDLFASPKQLAFPLEGQAKELKPGQVEFDQWIGTADGKLYGWGHCTLPTEKEADACLKETGIVNRVVEYLEYGQLGGMQWSFAAVLLAMTAALAVFTVWWARRMSL